MEHVDIVAGGTVVGEQGVFRADIVIRDGRIAALVDDSAGLPGERLGATGMYVFSGGGGIPLPTRGPARLGRGGLPRRGPAAGAGGNPEPESPRPNSRHRTNPHAR